MRKREIYIHIYRKREGEEKTIRSEDSRHADAIDGEAYADGRRRMGARRTTDSYAGLAASRTADTICALDRHLARGSCRRGRETRTEAVSGGGEQRVTRDGGGNGKWENDRDGGRRWVEAGGDGTAIEGSGMCGGWTERVGKGGNVGDKEKGKMRKREGEGGR